MRYGAVAVLLMMGSAAGACSMNWNGDKDGPGVAGSGGGNTRSYAISGFTGVDLRGSDDVDVHVGPAFSVRAEGPAADLDELRIAKDGDTLDIGRKNGVHLDRQSRVKIFVTLPRLGKAAVAGSGTMAVDRVAGGDFAATVSGSGNLSIAALAVDSADVSIAGSGGVMAVGSTKTLGVDIAGSGDLTAPQLVAQRAKISIAGSGDVRAMVNGPATVSVMGSGDVDLGRGAKCTVSKQGSGSVTCG